MARESVFQSHLIARIREQYPGAVILKNDSSYIQGIPDWLILNQNKWAMFEVKASENSPHRPNQDHYIRVLNQMSYASFVYPQNEEFFLHDLQQTLRSRR